MFSAQLESWGCQRSRTSRHWWPSDLLTWAVEIAEGQGWLHPGCTRIPAEGIQISRFIDSQEQFTLLFVPCFSRRISIITNYFNFIVSIYLFMSCLSVLKARPLMPGAKARSYVNFCQLRWRGWGGHGEREDTWIFSHRHQFICRAHKSISFVASLSGE